jgi:hypothetical protein
VKADVLAIVEIEAPMSPPNGPKKQIGSETGVEKGVILHSTISSRTSTSRCDTGLGHHFGLSSTASTSIPLNKS